TDLFQGRCLCRRCPHSECGPPSCLTSFPTRRSSDLEGRIAIEQLLRRLTDIEVAEDEPRHVPSPSFRGLLGLRLRFRAGRERTRSEEHTSELQSLRHLVCRLLPEKKKRRCSRCTPGR